jgi:hypothetical protein
MALPGTACLALAAPLELPMASGRAWFKTVNDDWDDLPVSSDSTCSFFLPQVPLHSVL